MQWEISELLQRFFKKQSIAALKNRPSKSQKTGKTGQIIVRKTGKQDRTAYIMKKLLKRKMKFFIWTFDSVNHCTNHTNKFMKSSRMELSINHSFTMVEENFEISHSEKLQNSSILLLFINHSFTMVEEIF